MIKYGKARYGLARHGLAKNESSVGVARNAGELP